MGQILKFLAALLYLSVAISCADSEQTAQVFVPGETGADSPTIALVMKSLANEFFVTMAYGARTHQESNNERYQLIINGIRNEVDLCRTVVPLSPARNLNVEPGRYCSVSAWTRISVVGAFAGVLIIAILQNGLAQIGVSEPAKRPITGGVIIIAVFIDSWRIRRDRIRTG